MSIGARRAISRRDAEAQRRARPSLDQQRLEFKRNTRWSQEVFRMSGLRFGFPLRLRASAGERVWQLSKGQELTRAETQRTAKAKRRLTLNWTLDPTADDCNLNSRFELSFPSATQGLCGREGLAVVKRTREFSRRDAEALRRARPSCD